MWKVPCTEHWKIEGWNFLCFSMTFKCRTNISTYLDKPRKNAWWSLAVVENFLGYFKAPNYYDLSKKLSNSYEELGCNISVKVHFFHSHVKYFPENLEKMTEEQGESLHQHIKTIENIPGMLEYQHVGRLLLVLRKRLLAVATPEKHRKDNFWISNPAIFSFMKKEYATMFGLLFAF